MTRTRGLLVALALAAALLGLAPGRAAASVVNPWQTTLVDLAGAADAIVRARPAPTAADPHRLEVTRGLWLREGFAAPAEATGDACVSAEAIAARGGKAARDGEGAGADEGEGEGEGEGIVFLVLEAEAGAPPRYRVLGGERGFVAEPRGAAAEAFVRGALALAHADAAARLRFFVESAATASGRVREDALREAVKAIERDGDLVVLADRLAERAGPALAAARAHLAEPGDRADPEPALAVLAYLPSDLVRADLEDAARRGVAPRAVGRALARHPTVVAALAERLTALAAAAPKAAPRALPRADPAPGADASDPASEADAIARALGHARHRAATPALVRVLGLAAPAPRLAAFDALATLRDPAAVPALLPFVRGPDSEDLRHAAVALAFTGGDAAIGALEHARWNHPSPGARAFVERLLAEPAATRAALHDR